MKNKANTEMKNLLKARIYPYDFNGQKSNLDFVGYYETIEEIEKISWKYEILN